MKDGGKRPCVTALLSLEPSDPEDDGSFWVIRDSLAGLKMGGFAEVVAGTDTGSAR